MTIHRPGTGAHSGISECTFHDLTGIEMDRRYDTIDGAGGAAIDDRYAGETVGVPYCHAAFGYCVSARGQVCKCCAIAESIHIVGERIIQTEATIMKLLNALVPSIGHINGSGSIDSYVTREVKLGIIRSKCSLFEEEAAI